MKIESVDHTTPTKVATVELKKSVVIKKQEPKKIVAVENTEKSKVSPKAYSGKSAMELAVSIIAHHEGFHAKSYRDHKGWSIGYGTRGKKGEVITEQEARKRLGGIVKSLHDQVVPRFPDLLPNQQAAIISLGFNCHSWYNVVMRDGPTKYNMTACNTASGKRLSGLVKRRANEWALFTYGVIY